MLMSRGGLTNSIDTVPNGGGRRGDRPLVLSRFLAEAYRQDKDIWGDATTAAMMRAIIVGTLENRPFDAGALASDLRIPHQTVVRRLGRLEDRGLISKCRNGRRHDLIASKTALAILAERTKDYVDLVRVYLCQDFGE